MKMLWNNFKVAFAMFSKIPMPMADWNQENMKYMLCFFPFVGTVIGFFTLLFVWLGNHFGFQPGFVNMVLVLTPVVITGGIHVDGLLDTSDAMSSWRDREKRLLILKDSHAGAFAVITACVYFLAWYGAYSQISFDMRSMMIMALGFMMSRCLSGISVVTFPKATTTGTVAQFSRTAEEKRVRNILIFYVILITAAMLWIHVILGIFAVASAIGIFGYYHHMAMKYFGGTTGDLSGCFLCLCEVGMALTLAVVSNFC